MITIQNWLYLPIKKNWPNGKKLSFYWPFKLKTQNLLLVSRVLAKKNVIQAYYQKLNFIEKNLP